MPSAAQQKLAALGLDKTPDEFVESLPAPVKRRVEALQELQNKHDDLEAQFRKERAELEAKYEKLYGENESSLCVLQSAPAWAGAALTSEQQGGKSSCQCA